MAVFGRLGSRPFNLEEQRKLYMNPDGSVWTVEDEVQMDDFVPAKPRREARDEGRAVQ